MKKRPISIRYKMAAILVLAAVVPLIISMTLIRVYGRAHQEIVEGEQVYSIALERQFRLLIWSGLGVVSIFLGAGLYISEREIIAPIRFLRNAAQGIAMKARLGEEERDRVQPTVPPVPVQEAMQQISDMKRIHSRDEIGDLSNDFLLMAKRVLRYHEQMETELATKTEQIEQDLQIAREFQEAFLPRSYPEVPVPRGADPIALDFFHIYKPATSVSGDLVHMIQLSDHEAGVFVADVMGHGARSALISAILRTLLQNAAREIRDPGELMTKINWQFSEILPEGGDFIFTTAFYAVFDSHAAQVKFVSAGHPSPLVVHKRGGIAESIVDARFQHPALALDRDTVFSSRECPLDDGDIFLVYTDGVIEAPDAQGNEYGEERLRDVLNANAGRDGASAANAIMSDLSDFMNVIVSPDDICIVTIGVRAVSRG